MPRKRKSDEPRHDFTAGPAVAPPHDPHSRVFEVFYQGYPTHFSIKLLAPVCDEIFKSYVGNRVIRDDWHPVDVDEALVIIAEYMDIQGIWGEALVDRSSKPTPGNPLAWSLRSRPGTAAEFTVWHADVDTGSRINRRGDGRWVVMHGSEPEEEDAASFDSLGAALQAFIAVAKALARSHSNA